MAAFKDHFSGHAAEYAAGRPRYPAALAAWLADQAGRCSLALDCGCGSGQLSALLAERFARVVGVDASPQQLAHAAARPRVEYRVAPAERTGLSDGAADLVTAAQAAHWFDLPAFWREARRVLRPGGLVAAIGYRLMRFDDEPLDRLVQTFHDETLASYWTPERRLIMEGYASLDFPFDELAAPAMEMTAAWDVARLARYLGTWSAVKAAERATGVSPLPPFLAQLAERWGDPRRERRVRWLIFMRVGRAPGR